MHSIVLVCIVDKLLGHADWPRLGKLDGLPDGRRVLEHHVDLLQVATHGLREEEVDGERNASTNACKDDVKLSSDGLNGHRGDHDNHEIPAGWSANNVHFKELSEAVIHLPEPVIGSRDGRHGHTKTNWSDLSAVEEVCAEETDGDEGVEQVDEDSCHDLRSFILDTKGCGNGQRNHAACHTRARNHENSATSQAIDGEEGDEG